MAIDKKTTLSGLPISRTGGLQVELVPMPASDSPWRTRAEWQEERDANLEALRAIAKSSRQQTIALLVAIAAMIATCIVATTSILNYLEAGPKVAIATPSSPSTNAVSNAPQD